jgi:membrane protease subunit HflK
MRFLWLILVLALVGYGLTGVVQVRPGERAVVRRFGRVLHDKPEPGLWIGLPWGMDRVDRVAVDKIQSVAVGYQDEVPEDAAIPAGQLLTGDHNLVNVQVTIFYKVRHDEVEDYVGQMESAEGLIARATETVLAQWVATRTVDDVLLNAKTALRPALRSGVAQLLVDKNYRLGVEILDARVSVVAPPANVKSAFDRVTQAQTAIATRINAAEQDAKAERRRAEAEVRALELQTKSYEERVIQLARAEAGSFRNRLREYQTARATNPHYLRQVWDEEMGELLKKAQENRQLAPLDHLLQSLGLDLNTAPAMPKRP